MTFEAAAKLWLQYTVSAWHHAERLLIIEYENLTRDPIAEGERLASFLGLPEPNGSGRAALQRQIRPARDPLPADPSEGKWMELALAMYSVMTLQPEHARPVVSAVFAGWEAEWKQIDQAQQHERVELAAANDRMQNELLLADTRSRLEAALLELVEVQEQAEHVPAVRRSELTDLRERLAAAHLRYQRLRKRRSVRVALALAQAFRPLFRLVRRRRRPSRL